MKNTTEIISAPTGLMSILLCNKTDDGTILYADFMSNRYQIYETLQKFQQAIRSTYAILSAKCKSKIRMSEYQITTFQQHQAFMRYTCSLIENEERKLSLQWIFSAKTFDMTVEEKAVVLTAFKKYIAEQKFVLSLLVNALQRTISTNQLMTQD
ncbi:hypothetical protein [Anaerotignum sp.]|uniref:hypothetical protein n=1 Tax=Anaerotignum sp. TaxID=2039241 RepID=UPI002899FBFF|nr:hypothetical protein [Anaerotignum sp.]